MINVSGITFVPQLFRSCSAVKRTPKCFERFADVFVFRRSGRFLNAHDNLNASWANGLVGFFLAQVQNIEHEGDFNKCTRTNSRKT